ATPHKPGFNTNKLTAWGGENLHRPTEEALLPINYLGGGLIIEQYLKLN
nr:hypothetical protein [bacterium]